MSLLYGTSITFGRHWGDIVNFSTRNSSSSSASRLPKYPLTVISAKLSKLFLLSLSPVLFRRLKLLSTCKCSPQTHLWLSHHLFQDIVQNSLPIEMSSTQWFKIMTHFKPGAMSPTCTLGAKSGGSWLCFKIKNRRKNKKITHAFFRHSFLLLFPFIPPP